LNLLVWKNHYFICFKKTDTVLNPYKKLGGQAIIYGLGNIVPRILNYAILTVYYTRRFSVEEYGVLTELYAYVAILMVILTYGMETGLFKFSDDERNRNNVFSTAFVSITLTSVFFVFVVIVLRSVIARGIGYTGNPEYIVYLGTILGIDAVSAIVFAKLRIENKVRRFALLKICNVIVTIFLVLLFLEGFPRFSFISGSSFYRTYLADIGVGFVFIANLLASLVILLLLVGDIRKYKAVIKGSILVELLVYSIPLLVSGLAGMFNETIDRILIRNFSAEGINPLYELGIYGANYRIAVLMTIFVQMFRYAAEPFFFNQFKQKDARLIYANVLKYFTIFMMVIFLAVAVLIDGFKYFIDVRFHEGLQIVPIVLMANVFTGMLFNVNMWYKLTGKTMYGVYITGTGAIITIVLNILFIPVYGYIACAWIHLLSNFLMLAITYFYGQKLYKIPYDLKSILLYVLLGVLFYGLWYLLRSENVFLNLVIGVFIVAVYVLFSERKEKLVSIFLSKHESKDS
jgi:O-antigen/teichoic acid export membrane protein